MITLTNLITKPIVTAAKSVNRATRTVEDYPTLQDEFEDAREALHALAAQRDLSTPFTDGGDIRTELADEDPANWFRRAEADLDKAKQDRDALLKGAAITAGATIGGLAARAAHRRGWITGALRRANKRLVPGVITKRYGKIAGTAARLAMAGQIKTVIEVGLNEDDEEKAWKGRVHPTGAGFVLEVSDEHTEANEPVKIGIPFYAIEGIEQKTYYCHNDQGGVGKMAKATLYISGHIPLNIPSK